MHRWILLALCIWGVVLPAATGSVIPDVGMKIYQERCSVCHGEKGDGRGPAAPSLHPKPTDFTTGQYKYRSTAWNSPPVDADLERTIREGLHGTAMPYWKDLLTSDEIKAVIKALKTFSPSTFQGKPVPVPIPNGTFQAANVEKGKTLYLRHDCVQCHGTTGRGDGPLAGQLRDSRGQPVLPRDLTDARNYRWRATDQDMYLRIATGLNGTPMKGYANRMSPEEIQHLAAYLRSLHETAEKSRWLEPSLPTDPIRRGKYLVDVMACQLCHTPVNPDGSYREELRLAGGMKVASFPDGIYYARNLTPDPESGLGAWSIEEIKRAITQGTAKNDRLLYPFDMPWLFFSNLTDQDAEAVAGHLKSLPPIYNKVPPPQPSGFWASFWNKTRLLFGRERTLQYYAGNSGETNPEKGQAIPPAVEGSWSLLPPMGWVPVETVIHVARLALDLPVPAPTGSALEDAMRRRGRYLVAIAPCALCHTAFQGSLLGIASAPLSGGAKISWGGKEGSFGTVYARNLTPDPETGLGTWTDHEIKRAIKSGITKEGRMMHWQAMPWDIHSNFTEMDLEAIVAYLRSLPPVRKAVPSPTSEAPPGYLVYVGKDYGVLKNDQR